VGLDTVAFTYAAGVLTATITTAGDRNGTDLFTVTLNETTGAYKVQLLTNVLHEGGPNDEATDATVDLTYTVVDADNSVANPSGTLTVTFDDDAPTAGTFDALVVPNTDNAMASGTNTGFNPGADGFDQITITGPEIEGITYQQVGNVLTGFDGDNNPVFTLEVNPDGTYKFTLVQSDAGSEVSVSLQGIQASSPVDTYFFGSGGDVVEVTSPGASLVNTSTNGLGVDSQNLDDAEILEFKLPESVNQVRFDAFTSQGGTARIHLLDGPGGNIIASSTTLTFQPNGFVEYDFGAIESQYVQLEAIDVKAKVNTISFVREILPEGQELTFGIEATDGDGDSVSTSLDVTVNVEEPAPIAPVVSAFSVQPMEVAPEPEEVPEDSGSLVASAGDDVFEFTLAEHGGADTDVTISGFGDSGNDSLDLRDLLVGEEASDDLSSYLNVSYDGANTVIEVSSSGDFKGNPGDAGKVDQTITLEGVDLVAGETDVNAVIQSMLDAGKLTIDS